jgi:integrase/recombinase XerD
MYISESVPFLSAREESEFLTGVKSLNQPKYYLLALIMLDTGARVSQAISLRVKDFNFTKPTVFIKRMKNRGKDEVREMPLTRRIVEATAEYWANLKKKPAESDYMFKAGNGAKGHIGREAVWDAFKKFGVNPHKLRHTCATKLIERGESLLVVKDFMMHSDSRVTEVYIHTSEERKRLASNRLEDAPSLFDRFKSRLFPSKAISVLPMAVGNKYHVGREKELMKLCELADKKVNSLVLGADGCGKSDILNNFKRPKVLRIDDTKELKKTLLETALYLANGDKEEIARLLDVNPEVITKWSPKRIIEDVLMKLTEPQEYTIIIDDVTNMTKANIPTLELLRGHFHMIVAAREIPIAFTSWLSNFDKIRIEPLNRAESLKLIELQSADFRDKIEDFVAFQTAVYSATNGNPRAIVEMVQRWRVEGYVRADDVQAITHTGARNEKTIAPFVVAILGCAVLYKIFVKESHEMDKEAGMFVSTVAMVLIMLSGRINSSIRQRFVR